MANESSSLAQAGDFISRVGFPAAMALVLTYVVVWKFPDTMTAVGVANNTAIEKSNAFWSNELKTHDDALRSTIRDTVSQTITGVFQNLQTSQLGVTAYRREPDGAEKAKAEAEYWKRQSQHYEAETNRMRQELGKQPQSHRKGVSSMAPEAHSEAGPRAYSSIDRTPERFDVPKDKRPGKPAANVMDPRTPTGAQVGTGGPSATGVVGGIVGGALH